MRTEAGFTVAGGFDFGAAERCDSSRVRPSRGRVSRTASREAIGVSLTVRAPFEAGDGMIRDGLDGGTNGLAFCDQGLSAAGLNRGISSSGGGGTGVAVCGASASASSDGVWYRSAAAFDISFSMIELISVGMSGRFSRIDSGTLV